MTNSGLTTKKMVMTHVKDTFLERNVYIFIGATGFLFVTIFPICLFVVAKRRKSNIVSDEEPDDFDSDFSSYQSENGNIGQSASSIFCKRDPGIYGNKQC